MRRGSDASWRGEDPYASVLTAVSQARDWIRLHDQEDENDAQPTARRQRFRNFGIGRASSDGDSINLDHDSEPTHSPQPRHVPGTPHPQHLYLQNFTQVEQQPPPPSTFQPASAPQIPSVLPATTPLPPASNPYQNMFAYMDRPTVGQFYQQPQRTSPFVLPTPLVPVPGLVATPMATSLTLPSSWAPNTPHMSAPYVPSPATSWHHLRPATPASGTLAWQPYPYPHPGTSPAAAFWSTPVLTTPSMPPTPLTPGQSLAMSGGLSLPGAQPSWTPVESWPPREQTLPVHLSPWLAPNPVNPDRPHVVWDVSEAPSKAQRISGKDIFVSMQEAFSSDATAVFPETDEVVVVCNAGLAQDMWAPITIRKGEKVTAGDIFWAVYEFFQKPITRDEVERIKTLSGDSYRRLLEACYRRCARTPGLADITRRQGVRRVDCLEDRTAWWGLWPVWAPDGTWSLHLSLTESHRA